MLKPVDNAARETRKLDGLWQFKLAETGAGQAQGWWKASLAQSREVAVPSSYNDLFPEVEVRDHVGDAWYQTTLRVPMGWQGRRTVLRFDAATHRALEAVFDHRIEVHALQDQWVALPKNATVKVPHEH